MSGRLLRERALSAPNIASPALEMNLNLDVPLSPSGEREVIFGQPAPIALAVDTLPSPSMDLPAAPASPFSDDERDVLAPAAAVLDTSSTPPETYEDLVSPIMFVLAPLSPVREMSPVCFAPPSLTIATLTC
ncbi:hypothetical protein AURDEDRAFT_163567 [Auricularia subglabra TFB-10046 SS5]|nr:hypothetical protein AURDEDRAFT_163567 [Auricularia subglabra TFB-10046 SS5]